MDIASVDLDELRQFIASARADALLASFPDLVRRMGRERVAGNIAAGRVLVDIVNRLDVILREAAEAGNTPRALFVMDLIVRAENAFSAALRFKALRDLDEDPSKREMAAALAAEVLRRFPEVVTFLPDGLRSKVEARQLN